MLSARIVLVGKMMTRVAKNTMKMTFINLLYMGSLGISIGAFDWSMCFAGIDKVF